MRWRMCDLRKIGIFITCMIFVFVLLVWTSISAVDAHEVTSGLAAPATITVQVTPTKDATVTALDKEKLAQEVQQLKEQNEPDFFGWLRTNASIFLSTLVVVIGALLGFWQWRVGRKDTQTKESEDRRVAQDKELKDRQAEREKRAEERFHAAVTGLGDEKEGARIGAAILLRTFLRPGYEQFYAQVFDLAVANLRLSRTSQPPEDPNVAQPLTTLSQALIVVFKEAFPLARKQLVQDQKRSPQSLDATRIQLDNAYLWGADLKQAWLKQASLRKADLCLANLSGAILDGADLSGAKLIGARLRKVTFYGTKCNGVDFSAAQLHEVIFNGADLDGANLRGVKGLTKEQLEACKAKGAIIDEDPTTSLPQSTVAPPAPSQSKDAQAPSTPSAQGSAPTPDPDGSTATPSASQYGPES